MLLLSYRFVMMKISSFIDQILKVKKNMTADRKVFGEIGISHHIEAVDSLNRFSVCAYFYPERSYCSPDADAQLILHEQYRWKIYELARLEIIEKFHSKAVEISVPFFIEMDDIKLKYAEMDRKYNLQTRFGTLTSMELNWRSTLDSLHTSKKHFGDSIIWTLP